MGSDQSTSGRADGEPSSEVGGDLSGCSILVVDDNEQNLELIQAYLEDLGCPVRTAMDGQEALASVERELPDVILLDVMMPRMSGFQACTRLKGTPRTRDIPEIGRASCRERV